MDEYTCPHVHRAFLYRLKQVLPVDFKPVIITDAGFKVPWFKQIRKLGWHYIARVRGNQTLQLPGQDALYHGCQSLQKSTPYAPSLG